MGILTSYNVTGMTNPAGRTSSWKEDANTVRLFADQGRAGFTRVTKVYDITKEGHTLLGGIVQRPGRGWPMGYYRWFRLSNQKIFGVNFTNFQSNIGISPGSSFFGFVLLEDIYAFAGSGSEIGDAGSYTNGLTYGGYGQSYGANAIPYAYPQTDSGALVSPGPNTLNTRPLACRVNDTDWVVAAIAGDIEDGTGIGTANFFAGIIRVVGNTISVVNDSGDSHSIYWNASVEGYDEFIDGTLSQPVYDNGYVYAYTKSRNDVIIQTRINATTGDQVLTENPDMSRYSQEKMRLEFNNDVSYIDLKTAGVVDDVQINSSTTYGIDSSSPPVEFASTFTTPTLFGWGKTGYTTQAYAFGTTDVTLTPFPLLEGTGMDVTVSWDHNLPPTPSEVGVGWTGPKWRYAIEYTTLSNASWVQATTSTTLSGSYTLTVNGLTGVRMRVADAEATGGQPAFSSTSPYATFLFYAYSNTAWGEVHAFKDEGIVKTDAVDVGLGNSNVHALHNAWPYGHANWSKCDGFGVFSELTSFATTVLIIPWVYLDFSYSDNNPPLKMQQRDDGLGPQGGPGRIGYYGRNGSRSIRLPLGGAW